MRSGTCRPAYSPADARLNILKKNPSTDVMPALRIAMPRENETAKYPNAMGMPSRIPSSSTERLFFMGIIMKRCLFFRNILCSQTVLFVPFPL